VTQLTDDFLDEAVAEMKAGLTPGKQLDLTGRSGEMRQAAKERAEQQYAEFPQENKSVSVRVGNDEYEYGMTSFDGGNDMEIWRKPYTRADGYKVDSEQIYMGEPIDNPLSRSGTSRAGRFHLPAFCHGMLDLEGLEAGWTFVEIGHSRFS